MIFFNYNVKTFFIKKLLCNTVQEEESVLRIYGVVLVNNFLI